MIPSDVDPSARRVLLAIALAPGPLTFEQVLESGLARPGDLWRVLGGAIEWGAIAEDPSAGRGHFTFCDAEARDALLALATAEDLGLLAARPELVAGMLAQARREARRRRLEVASRLYLALTASTVPADFPDGELGWVRAVVETLRLVRHAELAPALLERAIATAIAHGDLASQAPLFAARGYLAVRSGQREAAREDFARAREAADALADPAARHEVLLYIAVSLTMEGRLDEGIEAFEALQGDVGARPLSAPTDEAPVDERDNTVPEGPLGALAMAYAMAGRFPRALELLHRLLADGQRCRRPALQALARLFLGAVHVARGDVASARPFAEEAHAFWREVPQEPLYLWNSALTLASVRVADGLLEEVRDLLATGHRARLAAGFPHFFGAAPLDVLAWVEERGAEVEGLTLQGELGRLLAWPDLHGQGVAHRFVAERIARTSPQSADVGEHLQRSVSLLREAGGLPELVRSLEAFALWVQRTGRGEEGERLRAEAAAIRAALAGASARAGGPERAQALQLAMRALEIGRLGTLVRSGEGHWGEVASRLCQLLGAERCAIVERDAARTVLASRGGGRAWLEAVRGLLRERPSAGVEFAPPPESAEEPGGTGQLALVPFTASVSERHGWLCLENRHLPPALGPGDLGLLEAIGAQVGVLIDNLGLWQQLEATRERLERENRYFRQEPPTAASPHIIGRSRALGAALELVAKVAPSGSTVLVTGETGVGKELFAREVHRRSGRQAGPFIAVHIASLAPGLVASGLFGHERGAFTGATAQVRGRFELADGGTLFLDEIGELGPEEQVRLLRVLQEGTFERVGGTRPLRSDFRLVAATNRDLEAEVRAGRFREDLFFRLNVFPVRVPALRERPEDIPLLALFFMERAARNLGRAFEGIGEADMARLQAYPWPGNVRELEHVIERAALLSEGPRLKIPALESRLAPAPSHPREWLTLEETEKRYICQVLEHTRGRVTGEGGAAELLGLKPSTLNFRIDKLGLKGALAASRASAKAG